VRGIVRLDHPHLNPLPSRERKYFRFNVVAALAILGLVFTAYTAHAGSLDSPGAQKALVCSACHGFAGNSPGNTVPILAGMAPSYFKKSINDYAAGRRPSPEMEPYSKYVLQFGLDEIADFFAVQRKQAPARGKSDPQALRRGATLASQCAVCHGAQGEGDAFRAVPALQGQPAAYLKAQMDLFKGDKRKLEDAEQEKTKKTMFKGLDGADFADLAAYYSR
jgi:cytochrome c553